MLLSFNWHKYSFVFGIQKKGARSGSCTVPMNEDGGPGNRTVPAKPANETARCKDLFQMAENAREELKSGIREAGKKKYCGQDLLTNLQQLLRPYAALTDLKAHPFRVAINNVIQTESEIYCSIHLNNEELSFLWRKVR